MRLEPASIEPPSGLAEMLRELGDGEHGFGGTSFGCGSATLDEFLRSCIDGEDAAKIPPQFVPQTVFWMIDDNSQVIGMLRMRHRLNERLLQNGGHIGYYVRRSERGKGYAKQALRLALTRLHERGIDRALITVDPENAASNRVVVANGGKLDDPGLHPDTGEVVNRYWIDLRA
jgi:predicted acetyltransferase